MSSKLPSPQPGDQFSWADGQPGGCEKCCLFPTVELCSTLCSFAVIFASCQNLVWTRDTDWCQHVIGLIQIQFKCLFIIIVGLHRVIIGHPFIDVSTVAVAVRSYSLHYIIFCPPWSVVSRLAPVNSIVINYCDLSVQLLPLLIIICFVRYDTWGRCTLYYIIFILIIFHVLMSWAPTYFIIDYHMLYNIIS